MYSIFLFHANKMLKLFFSLGHFPTFVAEFLPEFQYYVVTLPQNQKQNY